MSSLKFPYVLGNEDKKYFIQYSKSIRYGLTPNRLAKIIQDYFLHAHSNEIVISTVDMDEFLIIRKENEKLKEALNRIAHTANQRDLKGIETIAKRALAVERDNSLEK